MSMKPIVTPSPADGLHTGDRALLWGPHPGAPLVGVTPMNTRIGALAAAAILGSFASPSARAAESYDNCAGTVLSLPAIINTQGVYCLRKDHATLSTSGNAITVAAHNVTLDCNGFKLGGLGAGVGTATVGVNGSGYSNLTVRNCNIRGFETGVLLDDTSGGGHLVEDNRFDGNTRFGMRVYGDGSIVRRNQVNDTGGSTLTVGVRIAGIHAEGTVDVIDNAVRFVDGTSQAGSIVYGIFSLNGDTGTIRANRVSNLTHSGTFTAGIRSFGSVALSIRDND